MVLTLVQIARKKLENYFAGHDFVLDEETKKEYSVSFPCFINIYRGGEIRGSSGKLNTNQSLWKEVLDNIVNAAFNDSRFSPLDVKELVKIKIEIFVLSSPEKLFFKNSEELLKKVNNQMGIILKKGFLSATFLPEMWEKLPFKKKFFEQLSLKAGLNKDSWKDEGVEIFSYTTEVYSEE